MNARQREFNIREATLVGIFLSGREAKEQKMEMSWEELEF